MEALSSVGVESVPACVAARAELARRGDGVIVIAEREDEGDWMEWSKS